MLPGHNSESYFRAFETRNSTCFSYFSREQTPRADKSVDEIFREAFILVVWVGANVFLEESSYFQCSCDLNLFPGH